MWLSHNYGVGLSDVVIISILSELFIINILSQHYILLRINLVRRRRMVTSVPSTVFPYTLKAFSFAQIGF